MFIWCKLCNWSSLLFPQSECRQWLTAAHVMTHKTHTQRQKNEVSSVRNRRNRSRSQTARVPEWLCHERLKCFVPWRGYICWSHPRATVLSQICSTDASWQDWALRKPQSARYEEKSGGGKQLCLSGWRAKHFQMTINKWFDGMKLSIALMSE